MLKVKNKKAIQRIAWKSFQSNKSRNFIAMFAIMLTTMLFCALFTIGITMNASTEMQSLRLTGGKAHASFKVLTEDQLNRLKTHPLIKEAAITRILSGLSTDAYKKYPYQAELRYGNDAAAEVFFSKPEVGHIPESENELATDTALLDFLGIEHKLGEEVTLTFPMGDTEVTHTFTLCGFWEKDTSIMHTQVWLSQEYVNKTLKEYPDAFKRRRLSVRDNTTRTVFFRFRFRFAIDIRSILAPDLDLRLVFEFLFPSVYLVASTGVTAAAIRLGLRQAIMIVNIENRAEPMKISGFGLM